MISREEYLAAGLALSGEANALATHHRYFVQHCERLYQTCRSFGLLDNRLCDVLEVGPFYGYTPFVLQPNSSSYTVMEGDDPASHPLKPLYEQRKISLRFVDLFEMFGPTHTAPHAFPFPNASFDTFICWGTMEHFNFNPVKFVREVNRVLRPGGKAYIQVPNKASFQNIVSLFTGRFELHAVDQFFVVEDYESNGKKAFYGFHWREYTAPELSRLFSTAGFEIERCDTSTSFQNQGAVSLGRKLLRRVNVLAARLMPRYRSDVNLIARKSR